MAPPPPVALTIAGTDSGGSAGLAADLKTFAACGVHGCVAVTAVTVQDSLRVTAVVHVPPDVVAAQVRVVCTDIDVRAVKTGVLASAATIEAVAAVCDEVGIGRGAARPFVLDPVAASMHGEPLLPAAALEALRVLLLPRTTLLTPNLDEVRLLVGVEVTDRASQREAARALHALGPQWVLVKGGHLRTDPRCVDVLFDGRDFVELDGPRIDTVHTHGAGDVLASATTAGLAQGAALPAAVASGKEFVEQAVVHAYPLGAGIGPVSPSWAVPPR